jgi:CBS domain-containing protein
MKVKELMTKKPAVATPEMGLTQIAKLMAEHNVGSIPVVADQEHCILVGVVTDRDIATRAVAQEKNPLQLKAKDVMSSPVITVKADDDVEEVARKMERNQVRRVPVVDDRGEVSGMVAQADLALKAPENTTVEVVQAISKHTREPAKK